MLAKMLKSLADSLKNPEEDDAEAGEDLGVSHDAPTKSHIKGALEKVDTSSYDSSDSGDHSYFTVKGTEEEKDRSEKPRANVRSGHEAESTFGTDDEFTNIVKEHLNKPDLVRQLLGKVESPENSKLSIFNQSTDLQPAVDETKDENDIADAEEAGKTSQAVDNQDDEKKNTQILGLLKGMAGKVKR